MITSESFEKLEKKHDVVDLPSQYWLEPVVSFDLQNTQDSQLDVPITPKAFRFCAFVKVVKAPITDNAADHMLLSFYLKHMKPQYETWCASKITGMKLTGLIETINFPNAKFKVATGPTSEGYEFTLVDLPCIYPYDWIILYNMLLK
ncbi:unnamed protein product [Lactuca saligna]|uniref:Uncharacterized protein n=1 Tax=Lactuca saligna TaxID=75948 RepID=A0AA36A381_LACSI|nr:unnamed protein product [Lactuca saligna]